MQSIIPQWKQLLTVIQDRRLEMLPREDVQADLPQGQIVYRQIWTDISTSSSQYLQASVSTVPVKSLKIVGEKSLRFSSWKKLQRL